MVPEEESLKTIRARVLDVAYLDVGPVDGSSVILLHGFPYDVRAYDDVVERLTALGMRCFVPYLRGFGPTRFIDADTVRSGEQAALGADLISFMDALDISNPILAGYDWGGRAACVVSALWPERVRGLVSCGTGYNIQSIRHAAFPAAPEAEKLLWYQYYLHSARGYEGLKKYRDEFCHLLWRSWSPTWDFSKEEFSLTAKSFDNPDFVDVVTHSYRHRFGLVTGDPGYSLIESKLAELPEIVVPAVVIEGEEDGVTPPQLDFHIERFAALRKLVKAPGVGHNYPQEAPVVFSDAVISLAID